MLNLLDNLNSYVMREDGAYIRQAARRRRSRRQHPYTAISIAAPTRAQYGDKLARRSAGPAPT
ncbi:MAG: hypothetical protein WKG07_13720 [Hymenobacter sp.]